jgi:ABC-type sugar transport system ATPase subunit
MPTLSTSGVTKQYGKKLALENVNLSVDAGSFTCLLGPTGAGKTTLLRIIAGLEKPDSGAIHLGDRDITGLPPGERKVGMVFQTFALYPHMTVYQNLASPLTNMKLSKDEIDKRVKETSAFLRMDKLLQRKPGELSGGEQQRVAIGRALVRRADLCLLDEPLTNLDFKIRSDMRFEFRRMKDQLQQTILYATPDPEDALAMADKVAVMNNGRIEQYDAMTSVYSHPSNVFVASYFGQPAMNLIDCVFKEEKDKLVLDAQSFTIDFTPLKSSIPREAVGSKLVLGARPMHLQLSTQKPDPPFLNGKVYLSEVLGSVTVVHVTVGDVLLRVFVSAVRRIPSGTPVWLSYELERFHLFDAQTGKAIR